MRARRSASMAVAVIAVAWLCASAASAQSDFPAQTGLLVDEAGVLDPPTHVAVAEKLAQLEDKTGDRLTVVILNGLRGQTAPDYTTELKRRWNVNLRTERNVMLIASPPERHAHLEISLQLVDVLTDPPAKSILNNTIVPRFRDGDFAGGVTAGVDALAAVMTGQPIPPTPAQLLAQQQAAQQRDHDNRVALLFMLALFTPVGLAFLIGWATDQGYLPKSRTGLWRGLAVVEFVGNAIWTILRVLMFIASFGRVGRSSSGGGSSGGGGATGRW